MCVYRARMEEVWEEVAATSSVWTPTTIPSWPWLSGTFHFLLASWIRYLGSWECGFILQSREVAFVLTYSNAFGFVCMQLNPIIHAQDRGFLPKRAFLFETSIFGSNSEFWLKFATMTPAMLQPEFRVRLPYALGKRLRVHRFVEKRDRK